MAAEPREFRLALTPDEIRRVRGLEAIGVDLERALEVGVAAWKWAKVEALKADPQPWRLVLGAEPDEGVLVA